MSLVYLVGSVHWDPKGPERLRKFLGFVRPNYICLEASEQSIETILSERELVKAEIEKTKKFDNMMNELYSKLGGQETKTSDDNFELQFLSTLGYETWVSYEHKKEYNPSVIIVPMHNHTTLIKGYGVYREELGSENIDEGGKLTHQFIHNVSTTDAKIFQEEIDKNYFESDNFYALNPEANILIPSLKERDDELEPRLREVVGKNSGTTVFVCGNHHFFADYGNNLYERVQDLSPIKIRLPDVDKY